MKKKIFIVLGIICLITVIVVIVGILMINQVAKSIGMDGGNVADYDKRVNIWNTVAGNSTESKLDNMNINFKKNNLIATFNFSKGLANSEYKDEERAIDTYT